MKRLSERDRRQHPRFPELLDLRAHEVQPLGDGLKSTKMVSGRVHNVSQGGMCFISAEPLPQASLVRCAISLSELPISVATLMQVRWTKKQRPQPDAYITGLQFLF